MDWTPLDYSRTVDTGEYYGDNCRPINAGSLFSRSDLDQRSLQETQNAWQQNFYGSQQSSLTSSLEGVGVSANAVFLCQSQY